MILFENKEYDHFFNPLCYKNKRIYYDCILQLIEKSKTVSLLYEADAKDSIILYLRNCSYALEDESESSDENISSKKSETENASAILRYFRSCSWISKQEIGRNGDNIASVTPYCRKMIDAIQRIFERDTSGALTNHIFAIYDTLKSALDADHGRTHRPYTNILVPLVDNISDLKNELQILKDSIRTIMRIVIKMTEVNTFGQFLIKDEMMNFFFNDYFFIKKDGLIPGYIAEIEKMFRQVMNTDVYENMVHEYQNLKHVNENEAREIIDMQFTETQGFINYDYVKEMDYIDKKINIYYNLYSTRMLIVLSNNTNMQTYLDDLLMLLKGMELEERQIVLSEVSKSFQLMSYKYIGRKSIERRKKRRPNIKSGAIVTSSLSDDEKAKLTQELLHKYPERYSASQAADYFERLFDGKKSITISEQSIQSRDDAMMMAASIMYSSSEEFPFEVEFLEGMIETEVATISNIRIKRKN
ncbi:Wadjet anti-phage system protein JetA family protein [Lacrimispora sp.]|uniref:Wadjet anti-phage system protein JetA family protein n=1 Tax=Lacrimispora sp. TaxID=2719234 RepID=UPI002FD9A5BA